MTQQAQNAQPGKHIQEGKETANIFHLLARPRHARYLIVRGVGEETGWRGFALPALQTRWSSITSSLVLGVVWAAWHFYPANAALLAPAGVFVFLNILATTFIFTFVMNHTLGSLLIAALFHMTLSVAEWVIPVGIFSASLLSKIVQLVVLYSIAVVLMLRMKANRGQAGIKPGLEEARAGHR